MRGQAVDHAKRSSSDASGDGSSVASRGPSTGSDDPLQEAFRCCHGALVTWVTVRTRDRALAEDVAAEAFERLLVTLRSGEDPTDRRAWLRRVALNLVIGAAWARSSRSRRVPTPRSTRSWSESDGRPSSRCSRHM
jgi:DNA-directed RNA polymerase specialized sigma24 family protein